MELPNDLLSDWKNIRSDAQIIEQAVKNRYPITEQMRTVLLQQAFKILRDTHSERNKAAIMRVILSMDKINADRERNDEPVTHIHEHHISTDERRDRISGIAAKLGIDVVPGKVVGSAEGRDPDADDGVEADEGDSRGESG